ncbi:MAG: hypothetical protein J6T76_06645 [Paludibacteraceae bacterium]|nr:hypothetical protein [Paludibacteraceae bacterium]
MKSMPLTRALLIDSVTAALPAQQRKVIRNGTLYIISGNDAYNVTGLPLQR